MIITDKYIYIHLPKTGGTFVSQVLYDIEHTIANRIKRLLLNGTYVDVNKHGICSEIPEKFENIPIFTTIRNPYDRYVSQYEFKWWQKYPEQFGPADEIKKHCPNFPDISFEEFIFLSNRIFYRLDGRMCRQKRIGWHTEQFLRYFFKDPYRALEKIDSDYIESGDYAKDMCNVTFIHTENLNRELHDHLKTIGYKTGKISFILSKGKINPVEGGRSNNQKWQSYYSTGLKDNIREKERFLFQLFPEYAV